MALVTEILYYYIQYKVPVSPDTTSVVSKVYITQQHTLKTGLI